MKSVLISPNKKKITFTDIFSHLHISRRKLFKNSQALSQKLGINLSLRPNQLNENDFYRIVE